MKIELNQSEAFTETEITINCPKIDDEILRLISMLRISQLQLTGEKDKATHIIDLHDVFYIESVDRKTFICTEGDLYESPLRLYEFEERLTDIDFYRISKSAIINFLKIRSIRPEMGGRLIITMENGERLIASRQYAHIIKDKLNSLDR